TALLSYHWKSPVRVHIEVQKFSNLKISFIFSDKEDGSIPASHHLKSRVCERKLMQALVCFWLAVF
ncbi:hypothetical protein, partial [Pseudomonas sp.]|uniref:hypothetical protein n=1 Tax=Pseudomonas sp. TaxID=306 RepID=UPI00326778B8